MGKYNIGEVWWVQFPYSDKNEVKRRPAIVIDEYTMAILAMYVTTKNKPDNPYSIPIEDWKSAGLNRESWTRIDKIVNIEECNIDLQIGLLSQRDLVKIMQLVREILSNTMHEFSLLAIKNPDGKYLQIYDDRWKTWLFPYIRSSEDNKANIDKFASNLLNKEVKTEYISTAKHCKYSVSDDFYKIFNHKLYRLLPDSLPENIPDDTSTIGEYSFKWMSLEDMEKDERIMEVNEEVIAFVRSKCQ